MKTLLIIDCVVALVMLILATEIITAVKVEFRRDYPNAKLDTVSLGVKIIGCISTVVKALIPIYNLICIAGFLFMRDTMIDKGYETLENRIVNK